ncbi:MAG: hypothetical protein FJ255_08335 [Phycisphaerae bacterium]|nr:hypothetical protein [Phycisphaerae bacterium]
MRILVRTKLYRAFPELDSYSDEQCERFVRAATRAWWRRILRGVIVLLVFIAGLPVALAAMAWTYAVTEQALDLPGVLVLFVVIPIGLMLVGVGTPPVAAFLARDQLLRRQVRFVLRDRGACAECRYSLIGLPVTRAHVLCPECGTRTRVDPSLGELTPDDAGRGVVARAPPAS